MCKTALDWCNTFHINVHTKFIWWFDAFWRNVSRKNFVPQRLHSQSLYKRQIRPAVWMGSGRYTVGRFINLVENTLSLFLHTEQKSLCLKFRNGLPTNTAPPLARFPTVSKLPVIWICRAVMVTANPYATQNNNEEKMLSKMQLIS